MATSRTLVGIVVGLGAAVMLASGGAASSSPRVVRTSSRRRVPARTSSPAGVVTLGPLTQIVTNAKTGQVTRKTEGEIPSPAPYKLLTDEQVEALEEESIQRARAELPDAGLSQQEKARRAAIRAREVMSKKSVAPIPLRPPSNPNVVVPRGPLGSLGTPRPLAYVSPPTPINLELARREAPTLAKHLRTKGIAGYSRQAVRDFQSHAGITIDGIYGPLTASALKYFGVANAPKAMFKAKAGSVVVYVPTN